METTLPDRLLTCLRTTLGVDVGFTMATAHLSGGFDTTWLEKNRPPPLQDGAVCHGDLHPLNIVMDGDTLSGVIDSPQAIAAEPAFEVAATRVLLRFGDIREPACACWPPSSSPARPRRGPAIPGASRTRWRPCIAISKPSAACACTSERFDIHYHLKDIYEASIYSFPVTRRQREA